MSNQQKRFQKNNEKFTCINCGHEVPQHPTSSRDHCNKCLHSLHVDIFPGDRANGCKGLLKPVGLLTANGRQQIVYECQKCNKQLKNIIAPDDDMDAVIAVSSKVWIPKE